MRDLIVPSSEIWTPRRSDSRRFRAPICRRCGKFVRRRESIRDRFRLPGTSWPRRSPILNMAAVAGKGQEDATGKAWLDADGKEVEDSATSEHCCCRCSTPLTPLYGVTCSFCGGATPDTIPVTFTGVSLDNSGTCYNGGGGQSFKPIAPSFSGTFSMTRSSTIGFTGDCSYFAKVDGAAWVSAWTSSGACTGAVDPCPYLLIFYDVGAGSIIAQFNSSVPAGSSAAIFSTNSLIFDPACYPVGPYSNAISAYSTPFNCGKNGTATF